MFFIFIVKVSIYKKDASYRFSPAFSPKFFRCPCLLNVINNIFDSGFRSLDEILKYLQILEKCTFQKIFCFRVNKKRI